MDRDLEILRSCIPQSIPLEIQLELLFLIIIKFYIKMQEQLQTTLKQLQLKTKEVKVEKEKSIVQKIKNNLDADLQIRELLHLEKQYTTIQQIIGRETLLQKQNINLLLRINHLFPENIRTQILVKAQQNQIQKQQSNNNFTQVQIQQRKKQLLTVNQNQQQHGDHESDWTDGTSVANTDQDFDQILVVDDQIALAMQESQGSQQQQQQEKQEEEQKIQELQEQFVVNGKSDHHKIFNGHSKFVVSLVIDPIQQRLISGGGDDLLNIYDLKNLEKQNVTEISPQKTFKESETISHLKLNYNSQLLLAVTENYISVYNSKSLEYKKIQLQNCISLGMHPLGNVFVASAGHQIHLYNLNNCSLYNTYYSDRETTLVEFTPNGKFIAAGAKGILKIIQPKTEETKKITGHNFHSQQIVSIDFKQNIALTGGVDGYACLSNWMTGNVLSRTQLHPNSVENVQFYNSMFLTGCVDGTVRWYDTNMMKKISNLKFESAITKMIKLKASEKIAVSTFKGEICVFDPRSSNDKKQYSTGSTIHELVSYKDYGLLAGCQDGFIKYFDIRL